MVNLISAIAAYCCQPATAVESARVILRRPKATLALLKIMPPLPKESLQDPAVIYIYPTAFVQWSRCMQGLAAWDGLPVLSYADYLAQIESKNYPTDLAEPAS
jgi:hypothetical protein